MAKDNISLSAVIPAHAKTIYQDWLSSEGHSAFTGGAAEITAEVGSQYTAWDGYISGTITLLEQDKRIVQTWRTAEFEEQAADSVLEIVLEDLGDNKTQLTLNQSDIPNGDGNKYTDGWKEHYFSPMLDYYSK